jgi:D-alanine-D-alanine ligase
MVQGGYGGQTQPTMVQGGYGGQTQPTMVLKEQPVGPVVLHLCGSMASEYYEGVSIYYGSECLDQVMPHGKYRNQPCFVHLDGTWTFPSDTSEEARAKAPRLSFPQAMQKIAELEPQAVVPHMFCLPGMTSFRALFDTMGIPIVGNPADVMALSTDKWKTKAVVAANGVKVPHAEVLRKGDSPTLKPPFLLKPCNEDNSQGISLVRPGEDLQKAMDLAFSFDTEVLCEEYIPLGRELRVAGLEMEDGSLKVLPCIEYFLSEKDPIRTAAHKLVNNEKGVPVTVATGGRKCPADIDEVLAAKLHDMVERSHKALGCQDYSLYDVRVDPDGEPYFIEACLYCSFAPKSVIVGMGVSVNLQQRTIYEMLVDRAIAKKRRADEQRKEGKLLGMKGNCTVSKCLGA